MSALFRTMVLLAFATAVAGQAPDIVVRVQKQQNAQAQLEYGKRLTWAVASARTPQERHVAVANAAARRAITGCT